MRKRYRRIEPPKHDWFSIILAVLSLLIGVATILLRLLPK